VDVGFATPFPEDDIAAERANLSGSFLYGQLSPVPGEADVIPHADELQGRFCPFWSF